MMTTTMVPAIVYEDTFIHAKCYWIPKDKKDTARKGIQGERIQGEVVLKMT